MPLRMIDFVCPKCGEEWDFPFEDGDEPPECPKEDCGGTGEMSEDWAKRIHRKGAQYKNFSWTAHTAGD